MKKSGLIALLLIAVLALTGCQKTFEQLDIDRYVTLGEYKGLTYKPVDTAVTNYELNKKHQSNLEAEGYTETDSTVLTAGTVQLGDTCNIDFKGTKDGVAFEGGTATGYSLTIGSGSFIAGFEEGLVGVEIGSTVHLDLTFPENYGKEELNGAAVVFEVKVNSVTKRKVFPEMTDALANKLDENAKNVAEYYTNLKANLEAEKKTEAEDSVASTLWLAALEKTTFKNIPEYLFEEPEARYRAQTDQMAKQYSYDNGRALYVAQGYTEAQYEEMLDDAAASYVQEVLMAYAIAEAEGFQVTDEIYQKNLKEYAKTAGYGDPAIYENAVGKQLIREQIVYTYAVDLIVENAVEAK